MRPRENIRILDLEIREKRDGIGSYHSLAELSEFAAKS